MSRPIAALLAGSLLLVPASAAVAEEHYRECKKITRQMTHYEGVVEMARERDNALWENATLDHIQRLADRRRRLCPEMVTELEKSKARKVMEDSAEVLKSAGKVALRVFTFGAYPGL
ncbi:MAG: hypothetical protein ACQGVK_16880 [Myxococcota bacterium]